MTEQKILDFIEENKELQLKLLKDLCDIPAPSHHEEKRAEYIKAYLESLGAKGVYIDDALNVVYPYNCEGSNKITVIEAHTDTVFPDMEPMPLVEDGNLLKAPGVGDDTASVTSVLLTVKYFIENNIEAKNGILFVLNSCEEGLGNLKGTRQLMKDYEGRILRLLTADSKIGHSSIGCVGSHRYLVTVNTIGGHSFGAFGVENALAELSKMITKIYEIKVPEKEGSKTTYNVGTVSGGTSVNTIAQTARMLCEYRSSDVECLDIMKKHFEKIFSDANTDRVKVDVELVGERPCTKAGTNNKELVKMMGDIVLDVTGKELRTGSSSTDCNIPMSMGIPAISFGTYVGGGTHTREEWVEKDSLPVGMQIIIRAALEMAK